jgi:hypothetical protein
MPQMGFEPTIPMFERAKTVHALDCVASVIGTKYMYLYISATIIKKVWLHNLKRYSFGSKYVKVPINNSKA